MDVMTVGDQPEQPPGPITPTRETWSASVIATISVLNLIGLALLAVYIRNESMMLLILGAVIANSTTVIGFYFGSSRSSQRKDVLIATQLPRHLP